MIRFLEHREPEDVFPTFYRANMRSELSTLMRELGLAEVEFQLIEGRPFFYFLAPISVLEILFAKFLRAIGKHEASSGSFVGAYQRTRNCVRSRETSGTGNSAVTGLDRLLPMRFEENKSEQRPCWRPRYDVLKTWRAFLRNNFA
jgi:hypothetical protein